MHSRIQRTRLEGLLFLTPLLVCHAQDDKDFLDRWSERVTETQAAQPHWITPLVTVTPRLEQEFRYDFLHQTHSNGPASEIFGAGKGLELIPARPVEIIFGVPPYLVHNDPALHDGLGDVSFLVKYRVAARNENQGNYIVTLFLSASVPTGTYKNGAEHAVITPTLALGKGWGHFSVQSTIGAGFPTADVSRLGRPIALNTAFQYRVLRELWPEFEVNSTFWPDGTRAGKKQVFLTPGLVVGRIPLTRKLGLTLGVGVQIAATQFRSYDHNYIFSLRLPFS